MNKTELQDRLLDTISTVVDMKMGNSGSPINKIGVVKEEPIGFDCIIEIGLDMIECVLPEHMQTWIQKGDVVLVQDLYGDSSKFVVIGKTGSVMTTPQLAFMDEETGKNISGVDGIFDEEGNRLNTAGTVII